MKRIHLLGPPTKCDKVNQKFKFHFCPDILKAFIVFAHLKQPLILALKTDDINSQIFFTDNDSFKKTMIAFMTDTMSLLPRTQQC